MVQWWSLLVGFMAGWLSTGVVALVFLALTGSERREQRQAADARAGFGQPPAIRFQPTQSKRRVPAKREELARSGR
jgi:hypothetical protein